MSRVAILSYHKIGEPPEGGWDSWYYVSRRRFAEDLQLLRARGWQPIDHATLLGALDGPVALPERAALITFDDAYQSLVREAVPVLEEHGFPSVVFVPTAYIGDTNGFDEDNEPEEPICTWDDLVFLAAHGMSAQAHGVHHAAMSELDEAAQHVEIVDARRTLEHRLGVPVECFAFPYGDAGENAQVMRAALASAGYRAAFLYGGGPADLRSDDRYRLPRLAMGPDTDLDALLG